MYIRYIQLWLYIYIYIYTHIPCPPVPRQPLLLHLLASLPPGHFRSGRIGLIFLDRILPDLLFVRISLLLLCRRRGFFPLSARPAAAAAAADAADDASLPGRPGGRDCCRARPSLKRTGFSSGLGLVWSGLASK